jgi:hypothetical protein
MGRHWEFSPWCRPVSTGGGLGSDLSSPCFCLLASLSRAPPRFPHNWSVEASSRKPLTRNPARTSVRLAWRISFTKACALSHVLSAKAAFYECCTRTRSRSWQGFSPATILEAFSTQSRPVEHTPVHENAGIAQEVGTHTSVSHPMMG